jgi:hypothetical protein
MVAPQDLPHTAQAVRAAAELVRWAWIELVGMSDLSPREQAAYSAGLSDPRSVIHPYGGDPLAARVVNVAPTAERLELGFPAYHLPERIHWGEVGQMSAKGRYYLVIPFTHGAYRGHKGPVATQARAMPPSVYRVARTLTQRQHLTAGPSRGAGVHAPGMQAYVPQYSRNVRPGYAHAARQERMVRRPGRARGQSQYLTFRTMTEDSPGWWIPPKPGAHLIGRAERETAAAVQAMIGEGVRADIATLLRQGLED